MGQRSFLQAYLREDRLEEKEKMYYTAFMEYKGSDEVYQKLIQLAKDVKEVWNDNFGYFGNDVPRCDYMIVDGITYFAPDMSFTKGLGLDWEKKDLVPDHFLVLFTIDEYKDKHECRGNIYNNNRFYTTVEKALDRLNKRSCMTMDMCRLMEALETLPSESILELDFSEVIQSELCTNGHTLEYYLDKVKELSNM